MEGEKVGTRTVYQEDQSAQHPSFKRVHSFYHFDKETTERK
jgi:hypothetical protein